MDGQSEGRYGDHWGRGDFEIWRLSWLAREALLRHCVVTRQGWLSFSHQSPHIHRVHDGQKSPSERDQTDEALFGIHRSGHCSEDISLDSRTHLYIQDW